MPVAIRTQIADEDLRNIAYQIGVESARPSTADRIVDELVDCCDQLAQFAAMSQWGQRLLNSAVEFAFSHIDVG
jgi:plasmid stabilization system protein ParE